MRHDLADLPQLFEDEIPEKVGSIVEMHADGDQSRLSVVLRVRDFDEFDERRVIDCDNAVRWQLNDPVIHWFSVHDDHPALLPLTDQQGDLYFKGVPGDPLHTADALRSISATLLGRYFDFDACINTLGGDLATLLRGGYGKVASGPVSLLRAFQNVLEHDGVSTTLLGTHAPKVYVEREMKWIPVPQDLAVLDLGESWIVAQSFRCRAV